MKVVFKFSESYVANLFRFFENERRLRLKIAEIVTLKTKKEAQASFRKLPIRGLQKNRT